MKPLTSTNQSHPVVYAIKQLLNKLVQHPEIYPIKYYKKGRRDRKNWKIEMV